MTRSIVAVLFVCTVCSVAALADATVAVELAVVPQPSEQGGTERPASVGSVMVGSTFYVEVWVQDVGSPGVGITGGTVDLGYTTATADAVHLLRET